MKRYIITYLMVLFALLFVNCTTTTEGLDEAEILVVSVEDIEMDYKGGRETIDIDSKSLLLSHKNRCRDRQRFFVRYSACGRLFLLFGKNIFDLFSCGVIG